MQSLAAFIFGLLFGGGLILAGMTDPARVLGFLDIAGAWNPALALVMAAAVLVALPAFAVIRRRPRSVLGGPVSLPDRMKIDGRLLAGTAIFGLGWGLAGICPGPALTLSGEGLGHAALFVAALLVGGWLADRVPRRS